MLHNSSVCTTSWRCAACTWGDYCHWLFFLKGIWKRLSLIYINYYFFLFFSSVYVLIQLLTIPCNRVRSCLKQDFLKLASPVTLFHKLLWGLKIIKCLDIWSSSTYMVSLLKPVELISTTSWCFVCLYHLHVTTRGRKVSVYKWVN